MSGSIEYRSEKFACYFSKWSNLEYNMQNHY